MKKFFYLSLFVFSLAFINSNDAQAQISVNVNLGNQPMWGPVGHDYVRYYYMPEMDVYYNVDSRKYTYWRGNKWVTKSSLPGHYRNYDIYRTYKVVINDHSPWHKHKHYKGRYGRYAHTHNQVIIRDHGHGHGRYENKRNHGRYEKDYGRHHKNRHHKHYDRDRD